MTTRVYKYGAIPLRRNPSVSSDGKKQKEELPKEGIQALFK